MAVFNRLSDRLPRRLWPENRSRRWIHGMAASISGLTFLFFLSVMFYGFLSSDPETPLSSRLAVAAGPALTVVVLTTLATAVPYVLGSLAARTARRADLVAGACGVVALMSLSFRVYAYGVAGGGQAFINMILHTIPFSTLVLAAWGIDVGRRLGSGNGRSPSIFLASVLGVAIVLGLGGSVAIWVLRDSPSWITVGGLLSLAALGLGFWATRRARQEAEPGTLAPGSAAPRIEPT